MGHPIHKHMHSHVTKGNVRASVRDDKAHMDYLKRDINYDNKHGHSDANMTADEKHISRLAGDVRHDDHLLHKFGDIENVIDRQKNLIDEKGDIIDQGKKRM